MNITPMQMLKVVEFEHGVLITAFNSKIKIQGETPLMAGEAKDVGEYLVRYMHERFLGRDATVAHENALRALGFPMIKPRPSND